MSECFDCFSLKILTLSTFSFFLLSVFPLTFMVNYLFCIFRIFGKSQLLKVSLPTTSNATLKMRRYLFDSLECVRTFFCFEYFVIGQQLWNSLYSIPNSESFIRVLWAQPKNYYSVYIVYAQMNILWTMYFWLTLCSRVNSIVILAIWKDFAALEQE